MARIGFIGLGVMGAPMAGHLSTAGHEVLVYNRTRSKAEQWSQNYPGSIVSTPAAAASDCEFVISCVGNDDDLRAVTTGIDGAFESMNAETLYIDHSTTSAEVVAELSAQCGKRAVEFIDAPVSGGQAGAEAGQLTVMCGGSESGFTKAQGVISAYAKSCQLMGPSGSGQLTKMVNQICIAGLLQGLAEGLNFGQRAGLDMHKVIDVISKGAAQSWQMDNRAETMCAGEFDFGFAVDWMRKDLGIVLQQARRNGASLPITAIVDNLYAQLQDRGANRSDTSSLISLLN